MAKVAIDSKDITVTVSTMIKEGEDSELDAIMSSEIGDAIREAVSSAVEEILKGAGLNGLVVEVE